MEKTTLPGSDVPQEVVDKLNLGMPDFMKNLSGMKKDLSGLPEMLKKLQSELGNKMKVVWQKEGLLNGKKVRAKQLASGEILIQLADINEIDNFKNMIR